MPFCDVSQYQNEFEKSDSNGVKIFYKRYGHGATKVLLIIGLAGTHDSWGPQIKGLTGSVQPNDDDVDSSGTIDEEMNGSDEDSIEICCFDNRGMGQSSVPTNKSDYTTTKMAGDALALLDHLKWEKAHVFGHSMGSMIACKLASMAPERLSSLALLNASGGGFQCFPKLDRHMMNIAFRFLRAKTPEERAHVDLDTHYTKEYLDEYVGSSTRRQILYQEYVKGIKSTGMQSNHGFEGQINACWTHKMSPKQLDLIKSAGFPISIIHGRYDIIAQLYYAQKLAENLYPAAKMVELHGAHLVSHERPDEVNEALKDLIKASKSKTVLEEWSCLPERGESVPDELKEASRMAKNGYFFINNEDRLSKLHMNISQMARQSFNLLENKLNKDKLIWKYQPTKTTYDGFIRGAKINYKGMEKLKVPKKPIAFIWNIKVAKKIIPITHGLFIMFELCKEKCNNILQNRHN